MKLRSIVEQAEAPRTLGGFPVTVVTVDQSGVDEQASPMIKPPTNRFDSKQEAFAHAREHGGRVFRREYVDPNTGEKRISFVVKSEQGVAEGKEDLVQIEYWQQETMESGRWVKTKPIPRATAEKIVNSFERGEIVDVEQGVAEGSGESYIIVRTDSEGKKDVFAGNFDTYERAQKELDGLLAHPLHTKYKQKFEIKRKGGEQGVAEGAPELLKKEMPLHRHAEKLLAQNGVSKDDPDYYHHLGNTIKHLRQFGNIDLINKQGVAEGSGGNWYIRVNGKILNDTKFKPMIFSSEDEARSHAMKLADKKRIPLSQMKLTKSWMDAPKQGVAEGNLNELDMFAPVTTYVRLANGEYVAASWRRNQDLSGGNNASFIDIKPLAPNVAKQLGLDQRLNDPNKNYTGVASIASGGGVQSSTPFSDKTIDVVDIMDKKFAKDMGVPDAVFGKIAQWTQQQGVASNNQVPIGEHLEIQMSKFIGRIIANEAIQNNKHRS
jgi:hypothetical protein